MKTPSPLKPNNLRLSPTPPPISPRRILYSYPLVSLISFNKEKNTKATIKGLYKLGAPLKGFLILWKLLFCSSFSYTFLCFFHHLEAKMLAIFSDSVVKAPQELIQVGNNSPTPKGTASKLREAFSRSFSSSVSIDIGSFAQIFYSHDAQNLLQPRLFAAKDDIFCLFEGALENLGSLKQHYGLAKNANEVVLVMEAYRALRDRAPYPTNHVLGHMDGSFAFIVFDKATSRVLVASDQDGKVPLFMGITADGYLAFSDDAEILRASCGKSLATFPPGCFFSTSTGLTSYEHPKNKVTAIPTMEEEMWGATFKIEKPYLKAAAE